MSPDGLVVGRWLSFFAFVVKPENRNQFHLESTTVWRWRWLPPIVPDAIAANRKLGTASTIRVYRKMSDAAAERDAVWKRFTELACPPLVPPAVAATSRAVAQTICAPLLYANTNANANRQQQARVLLRGPTGCGKSTATRIVADLLSEEAGDEAILVCGYDPARPRNITLAGLVDEAKGGKDARWAVVVLEEVECILRRCVVSPSSSSDPSLHVAAPPLRVHGDCVDDKASWNDLLDMLQFRNRVVLIMTTNRTFEELDALDPTGAMLRPGRVTARIEVLDDGTHRVTPRPLPLDPQRKSHAE
jgi:energy-coupling factor transporter ATP-binding protein EcfA2